MSRARRAKWTAAALAILVAGVGAWWAVQRAATPRVLLPLRPVEGAALEAAHAAPVEAGSGAEPVVLREADVVASAASKASADWQPLVLRVRDATSGVELRDVAVNHRSDGSGPFARADRDATLLTRGDSPLRLQPPGATARLGQLTVDAAGYEPAPLRIDWSSGGERSIVLQPAGALVVEVRDVPIGSHLAVRVYDRSRSLARLEKMLRRVDGSTVVAGTHWSERQRAAMSWLRRLGGPALGLETPGDLLQQILADGQLDLDGEGRARFEGLRGGDWLVAVFTTDRRRRAWVAWGDAFVQPGRESRVELSYEAPPEPPLVAVAGTLIVDSGWLEPGAPPLPREMEMRSTEPSSITSGMGGRLSVALEATGTPGVLHFDAGEWPPGDAAVTLDVWQCELAFTVPEAGERELELRIAPPADVELQVGDLVGAPYPGAWVLWRVIDDSREPLDSAFPVLRSDAAGRVDFRAPAGAIELRVATEAPQLSLFRSSHVLVPGRNFLAATARRPAAVEVTLREGSACVPWEWYFGFAAMGERGPIAQVGLFSASGDHDPSMTLLLDGEGPAQLIALDVEGYLPSAPVPVELVRGATATVEVALRRRN